MQIREPQPADARGLARVHVRAWQRAYRAGLMPDRYLDELSVNDRTSWWQDVLARPLGPRAARFLAEDEAGTPVGFVVVGPEQGEAAATAGEVYALNVDPGAWGRGAGTALLAAGTRHLRTAGFAEAILWVHPANARACGFYVAQGWYDTGKRREEAVFGVAVPEARYRRVLDPGAD
jgi:ribosomal protein S18 acetylase RimI-like enzyme